MLIKTTFKSHFKLKNFFKKKGPEKSIFVKNIIVLILFTKIFLKTFKITLNFKKRRFKQLNILKAPSRHKKFFHQISYEHFFVKIGFFFNTNPLFKNSYLDSIELFKKLDRIFKNFGSNTLTRTVFKLRYKINTSIDLF